VASQPPQSSRRSGCRLKCRQKRLHDIDHVVILTQENRSFDHYFGSYRGVRGFAVQRLAEVPGLGVDSAQQIIAEVGPTAATFPSEKQLSSWVGACPGDDESAGVNYSHRSPPSCHVKPQAALTPKGERQFGRFSFFKSAANRGSLCKLFSRGSTFVDIILGSR
jgi:phospholipase C